MPHLLKKYPTTKHSLNLLYELGIILSWKDKYERTLDYLYKARFKIQIALSAQERC